MTFAWSPMPIADDRYDILIVGGGINGTGIACDAAGRGLSVMLVEQGDLGSATSSASSKLIHGGLRYLEHCEFRLVREALKERDVLLAKAPHIVWPLDFVLPHHGGLRPAWLIRLGLFLYDALATSARLPRSHAIALASHPAGKSLKTDIARGFLYADCWVDDARLVVLNARAAAERGARVLTRTRLVQARRSAEAWEAKIEGVHGARPIQARVIVNAAGPWVMAAQERLGVPTPRRVRLVKGSHIVVPRVHEGPHAYILQNADRRIMFILPFEERFSLIGTTDVPFDGDPMKAAIDDDEVRYLCDAVNRYFRRPVAPGDIVWSYAGVRPLVDDEAIDPSKVTRDYVVDVDAQGGAPLVSIFGGKITTYRRLAEHVLGRLGRVFPTMGGPWTATAPLPGGDIAADDLGHLVKDLAVKVPDVDVAWLRALVRRHGSLAGAILGDARRAADLGAHFGAGLFARELDYLRRHEWAATAEDVLWRRTKCGLHMTEAERAAVATAMADCSATVR
jgi:glycerol-3-phosphate dehydrogenase